MIVIKLYLLYPLFRGLHHQTTLRRFPKMNTYRIRKALSIPLIACLLIGLLQAILATNTVPAAQAQSQAYNWKNVQIVGGGFVPGIIFSEAEANLIYARTDIGGAYRWNEANSKWIPLLDWVNWDQWGYTGVVTLAADPTDANRVYVGAGTYTNSWDPNNGAILRSTDKGNTWSISPLPFKLGGNMPGRGAGERLAVDPNKNSILYLGAPSGNGLWKSTDYGATWSQVTNFPNPGNYAQDPNDPFGYLNDNQGLYWVTFDKRTGTPGNATQTIYVGVADLQNTLYRTTNGGASWERVANQPTGLMAHQGEIDTVNGYFYITTSDKGGPYDGLHGDVWRYTTATGAWTQISPIPSSDVDNNYFGYAGLTIDRQNPATVMVTAYSSWWPDTIIWRSLNSGASWSKAWDWTTYPNRSFKYTQNVSASPWLTWSATPICGGGRPGAETNPKLGWMTETLEIDPFNSNRMMYGTGATIYGSDNLTVWDQSATSQIALTVKAMGLEETAVQDLISPPSGAPLLSALGDIAGFRHDNLDAVPTLPHWSPMGGTNTSIDFAELNPTYIFRTGDGDTANCEKSAAYSTNGGTSWTKVSKEPAGLTSGGNAAVNANGTRVVWSPGGVGVSYTTNNGTSWAASTGIPAGATVESDRVNVNKFYGFSNGTFYISTNGGAAFSATAATGLPSTANFHAVPGIEGDVWLAGGTTTGAYGLWHSTNSGTSFTKLANVDEADTIGFGKAATGQPYMALYTSAKIGGTRGIYRSDDAGATWVRINDDQHQWGWTGKTITGDPRIYGRVYLGTNGRGILYGDPAGPAPTNTPGPSPTPTRTNTPVPPTNTPTTGPSPTPTRTNTPVPTATNTSVPTNTPTSGPLVNGLQGEYYDNNNFTNLMVNRIDANINFDWVNGSPDPSMGVDDFTVRWTGYVQPQFSETYTFKTYSDDGDRLWVNGVQLTNDWGAQHGNGTSSGTITLTAGQQYTIKLEFLEQSGGASVKLYWSSPSQPEQIIPQSRLFTQ